MESAFVLLDRDGTINVDDGYVFKPEELRLIPGAAQALARLVDVDLELIVVTNQSAIGRGWCKLEDVLATNYKLEELLIYDAPQTTIADFLVCPHAPEAHCCCRKPKTGLIPNKLVARSMSGFIVGDKLSDIELGERIGIPPQQRILVLTGHGEKEAERARQERTSVDDFCVIVPSIVEASEHILRIYEGSLR